MKVLDILKKGKCQPNLSKDERLAVKSLNKNSTIRITPADKGNAVVVLNVEDYNRKALALINDPSHFVKLSSNPTQTRTKKLVRFLIDNFRNGKNEMTTNLYNFIHPSDPVTPQLYILIKVHKPEKDYPGRPIVAARGAFNYNLGKYLVWVFEKYLQCHMSHIKNSSCFAEIVQRKSSKGVCQLSFDVTSLYTMVPVDEAINVALDHFCADNSPKVSFASQIVKTLLEHCTKECNFRFLGQDYDQIDGLSMGNPLAPPLANLFMITIENKALNAGICHPTFWVRYVDDIYCHLPKNESDEAEMIVGKLNSIHPTIQFTFEKEHEGKLNFLNVQCSANKEGSFSTTVYRKPTNTNLYVRWESAHSDAQKEGVFKTLLHQAKSICSDKEALNKEINFLMDIFLANGYPKEVLLGILKSFEKNVQNKKDKSTVDPAGPPLILKLPFYPKLSDQVARAWKKCSKFLINAIPTRVVFQPVTKLRNTLCRLKEKEPDGRCVYMATCTTCGARYVGQTGRDLDTRISEHKLMKSNVGRHCIQCKHDYAAVKWEVMKRENNASKREIYETFIIREVFANMDVDDPLRLNDKKGLKSFVFP